MSLQDIVDFADQAHRKMGRYEIGFTLAPENLSRATYCLSQLTWSFIDYGLADIEKIPNDKRGIYAFVVFQHGDVLPLHGYVKHLPGSGREPVTNDLERCARGLARVVASRTPRLCR